MVEFPDFLSNHRLERVIWRPLLSLEGFAAYHRHAINRKFGEHKQGAVLQKGHGVGHAALLTDLGRPAVVATVVIKCLRRDREAAVLEVETGVIFVGVANSQILFAICHDR